MPTIREYRIVLPLSLEEFERARRWHKVQQIELEMKLFQDETMKVTEYGERTLLREETQDVPSYYSESFADKNKTAVHLIRGYGSSSPCSIPVTFPFLAKIGSCVDIMYTKAVKLTQVESWEAYPYFRSVSSNSSLGSCYQMVIDGICVPGPVSEENHLNLPESILQNRKVILLDIADNGSSEDSRDGMDPILFRSEKTGRGPLKPGVWMEETEPCMTCYILVSIQFDLLGPLGTLVEKQLHEGLRRAMTLHHRELFCLIDKWIDYPLGELVDMEVKLQAELEEIVRIKLVPPGGKKAQVDDALDALPGEERQDVCGWFQFAECPIEKVKSQVFSCFSPSCAGGSEGYSFLVLGFVLSISALFLAYISQLSFF